MRVLYLVTGCHTGFGGHFFSMRATAESAAQQFSVALVNLGTVASPILKNSRLPVHQVLWPRRAPVPHEVVRRLDELIGTEGTAVLHSFDRVAHYFSRRLSRRHGLPCVLTLCGGPNPGGHWFQRYFPKARDLVVYSRENEAFFRRSVRFRRTRVHLIPNRVGELPQDAGRILQMRAAMEPGSRVLLRICRISRFHEESAHQSIALTRHLRAQGVRVQLALVGLVQDPACFLRLRGFAGPETVFFTAPEHTRQASAILDLADGVVGTGRSFMEGACLGKLMLAPIRDAEMPVLVTSLNWDALFERNFSARSRLPGFDTAANLADLAEALRNPAAAGPLRKFHLEQARLHFTLDAARERYARVYAAAEVDPVDRLDLLCNWLSVLYFQLRQT